MTGQNPNVSKSNQLQVGVYSINSSKMMGNSPEVLNLNELFLKLNQFIYK